MIERPIPKEIRDFKEKIVFGLTVRQLIATIITLIICVPTYVFGRPYIGDELASWVCILVALPSVAVGFFKYNGMVFEHFLLAVFKYMFLVPTKRKYKTVTFFEELEMRDFAERKKERKSKKSNNNNIS